MKYTFTKKDYEDQEYLIVMLDDIYIFLHIFYLDLNIFKYN